MKKLLMMIGAAICVVTTPIASYADGKKRPMALMVMFDGLRADAVENACAPNLRKLAAGKWQPGYNGAWSYSAQTVPDAPSSSAPNHAAIATGVTTAKNCVTNAGKQFVQCDYRKWPSFLARIADARPDAKTLFMYSWKADKWLNPHPKVEFSWGDALATARHKDVVAAKGRVYARDLANGWELERRLEAADAPDEEAGEEGVHPAPNATRAAINRVVKVLSNQAHPVFIWGQTNKRRSPGR
jgi:hypothetical protein